MKQTLKVSHASDVSLARRAAKRVVSELGFDGKAREEIAIAVSELASNLVKHARGGCLTLTPLVEKERAGIQIESVSSGSEIADVEKVMRDGFSTRGSLGYGLGAVNRLMDEFEIISPPEKGGGMHIMCRRWIRRNRQSARSCPLAVGAATCAHPMMKVNGDAFLVKHWDECLLVGVIDGIGHGHFAHRAAQAAKHYIETHFNQPLLNIFRGVKRACLATRGVVMALARFDWGKMRLSFASIGNINVSIFPDSMNFIIRRGIVGFNTPDPVVTEHLWQPSNLMVLHSDGLRTHWKWKDFSYFKDKSATVIAQVLLQALAKDNDDATVVVVRSAGV